MVFRDCLHPRCINYNVTASFQTAECTFPHCGMWGDDPCHTTATFSSHLSANKIKLYHRETGCGRGTAQCHMSGLALSIIFMPSLHCSWVTESRKMRLGRTCSTQGDMKNAQTILVGKPEGKPQKIYVQIGCQTLIFIIVLFSSKKYI